MLSSKPSGLRLEVEVHRLLVDQQVGVDRGQVAQLEGVVAAHGVAALEALVAQQVRHAVGQHVEVDARRRRDPGKRRCRRPRPRAPASGTPGSSVPTESGRRGWPAPAATRPCDRARRSGEFSSAARAALHHVVPAAALLIAANCRHRSRRSCAAKSTYSSLPRRLCMRIRFQAIFMLWPTTARFCCQPQVESGLQSSKNFSWTNGLFVVVLEVLLDRRRTVLSRKSAYFGSPVASHRLIRYAGAWSPTEFQFLRARFCLRTSDARIERPSGRYARSSRPVRDRYRTCRTGRW